MKRLTREERRRIQRRAANIRFLAFVLILLALGVCIGYTAAHAQNACEPPKPQEVSQPSPVDDTPQEPAEQPAEDYPSGRCQYPRALCQHPFAHQCDLLLSA